MANKLSMPLASWEALKRIIRAYRQVEADEKPTVEDVAKYAGMMRPVVSANNNFLRDIGVLLESENKPTPLGSRLAQSLAMGNEPLITQTLQEVVRTNPVLSQFVGIVRARGDVQIELLKGEIALAGSLADKTKQGGATKAILDLLQEARLIEVRDEVVRPISEGGGPQSGGISLSLRPTAPEGKPQQSVNETEIPIALDASRRAYLRLPGDWQTKELPKLLKLLQITLGDDVGE
jgi:hypothetical protein